jgi:hypothetical protein
VDGRGSIQFINAVLSIVIKRSQELARFNPAIWVKETRKTRKKM